MKKRMKQEKKAKLKASKMKKTTMVDCESSSSSSSSESSDSDCGEVVDMNTFRGTAVAVATKPVDELKLPALQSPNHNAVELCSTNVVGFKNEINVVNPVAQKRIEVCMGNKCKKSGAVALWQEFEKVVGVEGGAVVECKCMGKCKTAPNVRIQNSVDRSLAEGLDDSVKIPSNPLCIGVGLEDVNTIIARFLGENHDDMGVAAATT